MDLESLFQVGKWCTGYQVVVQRGNDLILDACGGVDALGRKVEPNSLFPIYCASKPLTAMVVMQLICDGVLELEDEIGSSLAPLGITPSLGSLRIREVLSHSAALPAIPAVAFHVMRPADRSILLLSKTADLAERDQFRYSEFVAWHLMQCTLEAATGTPFASLARTYVFEPWGIDAHYDVSAGRDDQARLRINADMRSGVPVPILWEASASNLRDVRSADGGYASMRALCRLYHLTLGWQREQASEPLARLLHHFTSTVVRVPFDGVLGRPASYGLGFMTDLRTHYYSPAHSESSYGHTGLSGMTFAAADPVKQISYAVHLNGVTEAVYGSTEPGRSPETRRRHISTALIDHAELH